MGVGLGMAAGLVLYTFVYFMTCNLTSYHKINQQNKILLRGQAWDQNNVDNSFETEIRKEEEYEHQLSADEKETGEKKNDDVSQ